MKDQHELRSVALILAVIILVSLMGCATDPAKVSTRIPPHPQERIVMHETRESFCNRLASYGKPCYNVRAFAEPALKRINLQEGWWTASILNHERAHLWGWRHEGNDCSYGPYSLDEIGAE